MARAAVLALPALAHSIISASACTAGEEEADAWGPVNVCWSELAVPMSLREHYSGVCDPRSAEFVFNNTAELRARGSNEDECLGLSCLFSWLSVGHVAQAIVIMGISYLLSPTFSISRIAEWRCIQSSQTPEIKNLEDTVSSKLKESECLTEASEEFWDPGLGKDDRISALDKFMKSEPKPEVDHTIGWNKTGDQDNEVSFGHVQNVIVELTLQPKQKMFLLDVVFPCFQDPKDHVQIFGMSLADVHPLSVSFSEAKAMRYIKERLKQPAETASIPKPWSQRMQMGLFFATFITLLATMVNIFFLNRASTWGLVMQKQWAILTRSSMIMPTLGIFFRMILWMYQLRRMIGAPGHGQTAGPFDSVRDMMCRALVALFTVGALPQLLLILPLVFSVVGIYAKDTLCTSTRRATASGVGDGDTDGERLVYTSATDAEEPCHTDEPRIHRDGAVHAGLSISYLASITIGSCVTLPWFYYVHVMAEQRLFDTYLCMHSKVNILKFSLQPEALSGFVILLAGIALLLLLVLAVLALVKGSHFIDKTVPPEKFFDLWIHLSDLQDPPWRRDTDATPEQGIGVREAWRSMVQSCRGEREQRAETRKKAFRDAWSRDVEHAPFSLRSDKTFVTDAMTQDGRALQFASAELQADREIVKSAVTQDGRALKFASPELQADRDIVKSAVTQNGRALVSASAELKADRDIVKSAVTQDGRALVSASAELKADRDIVKSAVTQNGWVLQCASPELKADRDIVKSAVTQDGSALQFASPELTADRDIVKSAVTQNGWVLQYASPELKADRDFVKSAVTQNGSALEFASPELKADRDIVKSAVTQNGWALQFASPELQADPEVRDLLAR